MLGRVIAPIQGESACLAQSAGGRLAAKLCREARGLWDERGSLALTALHRAGDGRS